MKSGDGGINQMTQSRASQSSIRGTPRAKSSRGTFRADWLTASALRNSVIPRLVQAHGVATTVKTPAARVVTIDHLSHLIPLLLRADGMPAAELFVQELCDSGIPLERIYLDLFGGGARRLGEMWKQDRCDFGLVTIATSRLQRLVRSLADTFRGATPVVLRPKRVLLTVFPGTQHTLGLTLLEEFFRRAGWVVTSGEGAQDLTPLVHRCQPQVIGVSVGRSQDLQPLRTFLSSVRAIEVGPRPSILVGGPIFVARPELAMDVGADGTASDAIGALACAESLRAAHS